MMQAGFKFFKLKPEMEINNIQNGILNEWLLFDFKLKNGKTLLEDFYQRHQREFSDEELKLYGDLIATNYFALFEAKAVRWDDGLTIYDLRSGLIYNVKEKSATHSLKPGNIFYGRVARVGDHWELVGADSVHLPIVQLGEELKAIFAKDKKSASMKEIFDLAGDSDRKEKVFEEVRPEKAFDVLAKLLKTSKIDQYVSAGIILQWCERFSGHNGMMEIMSLFFGLARDNLSPSDLEKFPQTIMDVYNTTRQDKLKGLPQQEVFRNQEDPEFIINTITLGGEKWWKELECAHKLMHQERYSQAVESWNKVFSLLREEHMVTPDIYRLYANKAVCHFVCGEELEGKKMLELALKLNPNYDFAQLQKKRYESGEYNEMMLYGALKAVAGQIKNHKRLMKKKEPDSAVEYYNYVVSLGINFTTKNLTTSTITTFGGRKVRRNDSCPCGSGLKYKKCHGK